MKAPSIDAIVLSIQGKRVELTLAEAIVLRDELNRFLNPVDQIPVPYPIYPPALPQWPMWTCDTASATSPRVLDIRCDIQN